MVDFGFLLIFVDYNVIGYFNVNVNSVWVVKVLICVGFYLNIVWVYYLEKIYV